MKYFLIIIYFLTILFQISLNYDQFQYEKLLDNLNRIIIYDEVDPNDRVDVELWNRLNVEDIKKMPQIDDYSDEEAASQWLNWYLRISRRYQQVSASLSWNYETNMTEENQQALVNQSRIRAPFVRLTAPLFKKFNKYMKNSSDEDLRRIFGRFDTGMDTIDEDDVQESSELSSNLLKIYSTAKVCELNQPEKCYNLSPYLERLMQVEKDFDRLIWAWKGWHDNCGNAIRPVYVQFLDAINKSAKKNGFQDVSEEWISAYEMGNSTEFEPIVDEILEKLMPLYKQLHAYVRGRLCQMYPNRFNCTGPIPAHLLGNMWAQQWQDRFDDLMPYPQSPLINITSMLNKKKYSIHRMYRTAEDFFTSIGLYSMAPKFWTRSLFKKPADRDVDCQPSASNLMYHNDYRVKICTVLNEDYFYTAHHELGHVEYYMAYERHQPTVYRSGANSAFHEAIGDTIGIFAISPTHLIKLGFLDEDDLNKQYEINFLLRMALQKIAFLPFGYLLDKYRFILFRNQIDREHELNAMWWKLRTQYSGIMPPVPRHDPINFDPGAKYHVASNTPYFRYFIAHILQFQFYRALCRLQGHQDSLHLCDIYGNKSVGKQFQHMLAMGNSKSWQEILRTLTGEDHLEPQAMLDYFQPLYKWLKKENKRKDYPIGWM